MCRVYFLLEWEEHYLKINQYFSGSTYVCQAFPDTGMYARRHAGASVRIKTSVCCFRNAITGFLLCSWSAVSWLTSSSRIYNWCVGWTAKPVLWHSIYSKHSMSVASSFITIHIIKRKVLKLHGKRPIRRPKVWEEDVINTNLRAIYCEHINWIWRVPGQSPVIGLSVQANVSLGSLTQILDWVNKCQVLKESFLSWRKLVSFFTCPHRLYTGRALNMN